MKDYSGTFEMVDPMVVIVDHRYQRPEKPALVAAISTDPRWELFGVPVLFKRGNLLYVADGQQRIAGVKASANPPRQIPAIWFSVEHLEDEAAVFVQINEFRKSLTPLEKHKGKIVAKDPATLAIERVVSTVGMSIGHGGTGDTKEIASVAALYTVYNLIGEDGLLQTLVVIRDAFQDDTAALSSPILRAVANIIMEQDGDYERSKLTAALSKTTVPRIMRKTEEFRFEMGGSQGKNIRRAIKELAKV